MFKLFIVFVLLYIVFVQGRHVYLNIYKFFRESYKSKHPEVTITQRPSPRSKKKNKKGEYIDYEELN